MKTLAFVLGGAVLALIVFGSVGSVRAQTSAAAVYAGNAENGKRLFVRNGCYECHNYNAAGGRQGARLAQTKLTAAAFIAYVRRPRTMPAYGPKVMSDGEATDVWAYIKSIPEPPPVSSIPILNLD